MNSLLNEVLGHIISRKCSVSYLGNLTKVVLREHNYLVKILHTAGRKVITRTGLQWTLPDRDSMWLKYSEL